MELGESCWWDFSYNYLGGCRKVREPCRNCFAPPLIGNVASAHDVDLYRGVTRRTRDGHTWTGQANAHAPGHPSWVLPLDPPVVERPKLGPGKPLLVALNVSSGDTFYEKHPLELIDRGLRTVAASADVIGLIPTRRTQRMLEYFLDLEAELSPEALRRWQAHLWPGFSAGNQDEFIELSPPVLELARRGWTTFGSFAPLIEPIVVTDEFLRLIKWLIVSGEKTKHERCRYMDPAWALSLLAQCRAAHIPFFMKRMSFDEYIPPELFFREFPRVEWSEEGWRVL
jgi:protein gp37